MADDYTTSLSADTLQILQQFYMEKQKQEEEEEKLLKNNDLDKKQAENFSEDWQLSQFWYEEKTRDTAAQEGIKESTVSIACLCTPSIARSLQKITSNDQNLSNLSWKVFEFDKRFSFYGEKFVFYDFNYPEQIPKECLNAFDFIIADPPFLNEACFSEVAKTVNLIARPNAKIMFLTGATMEPVLEKLFKGIRRSKFEPKHANQLSNAFGSFLNYKSNDQQFSFL